MILLSPLHFTAITVDDGDVTEEVFAIQSLWQGTGSQNGPDAFMSEVLITFRTYAEVQAFCQGQQVTPVLDAEARTLREELENAMGNEDGDGS